MLAILNSFKRRSTSSKSLIVLSFFIFGFIGIYVASPGNATARTTSCGTVGNLQNGGFENGSASWQTTATDGAFEVWSGASTTRPDSSTFNFFGSDADYTHEGTSFIELMASSGGINQGIYQDIATTPGSQIFISFWHHFRDGRPIQIATSTQSVAARVGAVPNNIPASNIWTSAEQTSSTTFGTRVASNNANLDEDWEQVTAVYRVPDGQTNTRFLILNEASPTDGFGNFLDDVQFTPFMACPVTRTLTFGNSDSLNVVTENGATYGSSQTLTSITTATNPNGSAGTASRSGNQVSFTPVAAGNGQYVDYTASMTFLGTTYTDESRITYNVEATVPGAPTGLSASSTGRTSTTDTTAASITLTWNAPSSNGGVAISDYVVEYKEGAGAWTTFADGVSATRSATITGLTGTSTTLVRVSAKNDGSGYTDGGTTGTGPASSELSVAPWVCSNLDELDNITGMVLWVRADCVNGTSTNPSDGSAISRWEDLSGSNNDATTLSGQANPTFQNDSGNLINGQPVLNFTRTSDASGTVLEVSGVDIRAATLPDVSIFVVYKPRRVSGDGSENHGVWGVDNGGWDRFFLSKFGSWPANPTGQANNSNDGLISLGPTGSSTPTSCTTSRVCGSGTNGVTRLLTTIYDGNVSSGTNSGTSGASKVYFGSTLTTSFTDSTTGSSANGPGSAGAKDKFYIGWDGDNSAFRGDIAELIIFNRALESDLPSINQYLNDRYNLDLNVSTNLPDVVLVDPRVTAVNFPSLDLSTSTNAMICFSQANSQTDSNFSGTPNISITRTSTVSGVTSTNNSNDWRFSGTRANVDSQLDSVQISGTNGNSVVTNSSKWLRVRVTSSTTDCSANSPVSKTVEIRPIGLNYNRDTQVTLE
jgi:hypothetical protein